MNASSKPVSKDPLKTGVKNFPFLTDYVNETFNAEQKRLDYRLLRPILTAYYFFLRLAVVPAKFLFHRNARGWENRLIDRVIAFGIKRLASTEALELLIRHVQIEPLLYRYVLSGTPERLAGQGARLKGIDGDFSVDSVEDVVAHGLTICHDDLSYELMERFDRSAFLDNIAFYRNSRPESIEQFGNKVLEQNRKSSLQLFGATNVVIFIVITITLVGDLKTIVRALNSFDSDAVLLWCAKSVCADDPQTMVDLDFYLQDESNRSHYSNGPFLSDPSRYLYHHIAFDEFVYELLRKNTDTPAADPAPGEAV